MDAITIVTRRAAGCHRVGRNRNRDLVREYGKRFAPWRGGTHLYAKATGSDLI